MSHLAPHSDVFFEDEALLPVQYADLVKRRPGSPEHRLLLAVLEDAVRCWQAYHGARGVRDEQLFREVAEWFDSDADDSPFTFVAICQLLGLDPDHIRFGLRRWGERLRAAPGSVAPLRLRRIAGTRHAIRGERRKGSAAA